MDPLASVVLLAFADPTGLSTRELAVGVFLVLAILYIVLGAFRSGPARDRSGRFRSKRRTQFLGLLKIGVFVSLLWLVASLGGVI